MVRIDVHDQDIVQLALVRLLARVRQEPGGVEFVDRHPPAAIGNEVHGLPP
jgi:hypothetical protein